MSYLTDLFGDGSTLCCFPLDGDANDITGNLSGSMHGGTWVEGKILDGVDFGSSPNTSNYLQIDDIPMSTDMTFCMWAYQHAHSSSLDTIFSMADDGTSERVLLYYYTSASPQKMVIEVNDNPYTLYTGSGFPVGRWFHVAIRLTGSKAALFIDGELKSEVSAETVSTSYSGDNVIIIGQEQDSRGGGFDENQCWLGMVDHFRAFSRALSADEIMDVYAEREHPRIRVRAEYLVREFSESKRSTPYRVRGFLKSARRAEYRVRGYIAGRAKAPYAIESFSSAKRDVAWCIKSFDPPDPEFYKKEDPFGSGGAVALFGFDDSLADSGGAFSPNASGAVRYGCARFGHSVRLGEDGRIEYGDVEMMGTFSVCAWVNKFGDNSRTAVFASGDTMDHASVYVSDNIEYADISGGAVRGSVGISSGWHHIAVVGDEKGVGVYVDGMLDAYKSGAYASGGETNLRISTGPIAIDQLRIFSRALDDDEVLSLYYERYASRQAAIVRCPWKISGGFLASGREAPYRIKSFSSARACMPYCLGETVVVTRVVRRT